MACETFDIYNGKIYYMELEKKTEEHRSWEYVYCEMEPDGTGRRELYRRKARWPQTAFAAGGGCLYVEDAAGDGITGINLKTGDTKHYDTSGRFIEWFCYENGYLYIWLNSADYCNVLGNILRINAVSDEKEYLADAVMDVWMEDGCLYYVWRDYGTETIKCCLSVLNLETKQLLTEILEEEGEDIRDGYLEVVGDSLLVSVTRFRDRNKYQSIREKTICFKYGIGKHRPEMLDRKERLEVNP